MRVRGVDANLNSVSRALLADRSRAGQDNPYQLDLETGATFEVDDLEGASGAFTKGDLGAINASGNAAGRLEPAGDEAQPRGTTRGAP